jgi:hypothetical protein
VKRLVPSFDDLMFQEMCSHCDFWLDSQNMQDFSVARGKTSLQLEYRRKGTGGYGSSIYLEDLPEALQQYSLDDMLAWLLSHGAKLKPELAGMEDLQDRTKHTYKVTLVSGGSEYVVKAVTINPEEAREEAKKQAKKWAGNVRFRTKSIEDLGEVQT